jgi:O-antigen/teichoic acid export membrane protein
LPVVKNPFLQKFCGSFSTQHLLLSVPYFLPPFIIFLNAKADTFAVALTLPENELGEYYVLISLLYYCHAIAALALVPFLKNIYRIKLKSLAKVKRMFFLYGIAWSAICMTFIVLVIEFVYKIHFDAFTYTIAAGGLPPFFIYYLIIQEFYRQDNPYPVVVINLAGAVLNFIISLLMIKSFGFMGGVGSFAIMQWVLLAAFVVSQTKRAQIWSKMANP